MALNYNIAILKPTKGRTSAFRHLALSVNPSQSLINLANKATKLINNCNADSLNSPCPCPNNILPLMRNTAMVYSHVEIKNNPFNNINKNADDLSFDEIL